MTFTTRFAPSPTGPLHLGHAYSALLAFDMAQAQQGRFLLRIEDTDTGRSRLAWEQQIYEDLTWLGLTWEHPLLRQSEHLPHYNAALMKLAERGLIYPCSCRRSDIKAALSAPQEGVPLAPGVYPGMCRHRKMDTRQSGDALRLNLGHALKTLGPLNMIETGAKHSGTHQLDPKQLMRDVGDPVLGRKEIETPSYVLAAVIDDAAQEITHVVRGEDLYQTTFLQMVLQALLDLPTPIYHHHGLIRDEQGKRLAKRDDARAISKYRADGVSPSKIRTLVGL
ncbi:tRNA glutamyl-Q(34) synthetase GluQRS [Phaeobacter gallaeciensis]|uniref:tRNA glutamyl-Q(34) synthetase GluQRS n=2 Tax=Roseobacteraceae TaxID=2854170 RepID=A0A366X9M1_9RHOB|nr:tRNA glutamyl-Q(34) synthetase GluQRS [Phaeobacter gallaeciensis]MBT3140598.1 tRNA glutamyl-Q(34) synthetase GluQRS [Falsiruegeria litorea]MBT8170337.1 tRNA glutamyl-Q(34) synthetase GluQRS [Falsiruegeria litorea]RBW61986.1 tRNA glutamyl-Q(34) synthetase GluQRS [Phaeobacter gallaeciensis]